VAVEAPVGARGEVQEVKRLGAQVGNELGSGPSVAHGGARCARTRGEQRLL
jgi:hypothetical protein